MTATRDEDSWYRQNRDQRGEVDYQLQAVNRALGPVFQIISLFSLRPCLHVYLLKVKLWWSGRAFRFRTSSFIPLFNLPLLFPHSMIGIWSLHTLEPSS